MRLDLGTVLLQWAGGGLAFLWVTTRRREVSLGYGWLLRVTYAALGAGGVVVGISGGDHSNAALVREAAGGAMVAAALAALAVSVVRRRAGVGGLRARTAARQSRVAAMLGRSRAELGRAPTGRAEPAVTGPEFPPALDMVAPAFGLASLVGAASAVGGPYALSAARLVVGAAFLGCISDAMLLGHWYLTQPGLPREPIKELVRLALGIAPVEVLLMLVPTGMVDVLDGSIDDGYGGIVAWMWAVSAVSTVGLLLATRAALKERAYSAVMAATGLLYLAILTAFGTDVLARALFS